MMSERGVAVDHATLHPPGYSSMPRSFNKLFRHRQRPRGRSWWLDETYVKIKGNCRRSWYRAVGKEGEDCGFSADPATS